MILAALDFSPIRDDLQLVEKRLAEMTSVDHPMLCRILSDIMGSGGKRLRPALVLLAGHFAEYDRQKSVALAAGIETLHTATLVHDDLIDDSLRRRGRATLNSEWRGGMVVLVGDYLFAQAASLANEARNVDANDAFIRAVAVICGGELRNMLDKTKWQTSRANYFERIYAKTASLFATACEVGAIANNATPEVRAALREYGHKLGMAFQVVDDILDFVGDERELGKPVGSDLRQGTVTLPAIAYIERNRHLPIVQEVLAGNGHQENVPAIIDLISQSEAIAESYSEAATFVGQAKAALTGLPHIAARQALLDLADFVVERRN